MADSSRSAIADRYSSRGTSNAQEGPFFTTDIIKMHRSGELRPDDLLWREGWTEWRSVRDTLASLTTPPPLPARGPDLQVYPHEIDMQSAGMRKTSAMSRMTPSRWATVVAVLLVVIGLSTIQFLHLPQIAPVRETVSRLIPSVMKPDAGDAPIILTGETDPIQTFALSADGSKVATISASSTGSAGTTWRVTVSDARSGALLLTLPDQANYAVKFNRDGSRLVTVTHQSFERTIRTWDASTGAPISSFSYGGNNSPFFLSSDGERLVTFATTTDAGALNPLQIWNTATGTQVSSLSVKFGNTKSALSNDGQRLAHSYTETSVVSVYDTRTGAVATTFTSGAPNSLRDIQFSQDGNKLAIGSNDKTAKIWDTKTGALLKTFDGHPDQVSYVKFSPDGQRIATVSIDGTRIWDAGSGTLLSTLGSAKAVGGIEWSADGRLLFAIAYGDIHIWDTQTAKHLSTLTGAGQFIMGAAFNPDSKSIFLATGKGALMRNLAPESLARNEAARTRAISQRPQALAALDCERVKRFDAIIGWSDMKYSGCLLDYTMTKATAREMYATALDYEKAGRRDDAKRVLNTQRDRFPTDSADGRALLATITEKEETDKRNAAAVEQARKVQEQQERQRADAEFRSRECAGLYPGKRIRQSVLLGMGMAAWDVVGLSVDTTTVTLRDSSNGYTREVPCYEAKSMDNWK